VSNQDERAGGVQSARGHTEKAHHRAESLYKADWWVEHLEDEIEPNLAEDLELLLKNSKEDHKILASLKRTRQAVKASDDVAMPESGLYYNDLHNKIMAAIDFEEIPESRREKHEVSLHVKSRRAPSFAWNGAFGAMGLTMMLALITWMGMRDMTPSASQSSPAIASIESSTDANGANGENLERTVATVSGSFSDDVNAFESEQEIVEEAAIQKLSQLSQEQVDELYRTLRQ
jgi:hypothetical protein